MSGPKDAATSASTFSTAAGTYPTPPLSPPNDHTPRRPLHHIKRLDSPPKCHRCPDTELSPMSRDITLRIERVVLPLDAGMGAVAHRWAKAASLWMRPGLPPAVTA